MSKSLFVQVSTSDADTLTTQLQHVVDHHRDPAGDDYIENLILDEIGLRFSLHFSQLDAIEPFLSSFNQVFIGSHFISWEGAGGAYAEGIANSEHRWANLKTQKKLWQDYADNYSNDTNFYINHEGVLDYFDIPHVRAGYEAYLIQSVRDSHSINPEADILWSPAVWSGVELSDAEESAIATTFRNVSNVSVGVNWLHLQDMMGRGRIDITKEDVAQWYGELKAMDLWDNLAINMEAFTRVEGGLVAADTDVLQAREDWYTAQDIPVESMFELRYWYESHATHAAAPPPYTGPPPEDIQWCITHKAPFRAPSYDRCVLGTQYTWSVGAAMCVKVSAKLLI